MWFVVVGVVYGCLLLCHNDSAHAHTHTHTHIDISYHSNSSGDLDTLERDHGYHGSRDSSSKIPAHVNESISISDMDRDTTDIEVRKYVDIVTQLKTPLIIIDSTDIEVGVVAIRHH